MHEGLDFPEKIGIIATTVKTEINYGNHCDVSHKWNAYPCSG